MQTITSQLITYRAMPCKAVEWPFFISVVQNESTFLACRVTVQSDFARGNKTVVSKRPCTVCVVVRVHIG